jgi:hypothetical protein
MISVADHESETFADWAVDIFTLCEIRVRFLLGTACS